MGSHAYFKYASESFAKVTTSDSGHSVDGDHKNFSKSSAAWVMCNSYGLIALCSLAFPCLPWTPSVGHSNSAVNSVQFCFVEGYLPPGAWGKSNL